MAADRPPNRDRGAPDPDEFAVLHALRDALPTVRHASMLFDMVTHLLGDEAMVETVTGGEIRVLYRRASPGSTVAIPWPLLTLSYVPVPVVPMDLGFGLAEPLPPRPEVAPELRGLKPGYVIVRKRPGTPRPPHPHLPRDADLLKRPNRLDPLLGGRLRVRPVGTHQVGSCEVQR